jgi:hypothetical protein
MDIVDVGRTLLLALHAGQAGPKGLIRENILIASAYRLGQKTSGRKPVINPGDGTDGGTLSAVQAKESFGLFVKFFFHGHHVNLKIKVQRVKLHFKIQNSRNAEIQSVSIATGFDF